MTTPVSPLLTITLPAFKAWVVLAPVLAPVPPTTHQSVVAAEPSTPPCLHKPALPLITPLFVAVHSRASSATRLATRISAHLLHNFVALTLRLVVSLTQLVANQRVLRPRQARLLWGSHLRLVTAQTSADPLVSSQPVQAPILAKTRRQQGPLLALTAPLHPLARSLDVVRRLFPITPPRRLMPRLCSLAVRVVSSPCRLLLRHPTPLSCKQVQP